MNPHDRDSFHNVVKQTLEQLSASKDETYQPWQALFIIREREPGVTLRAAVLAALRQGVATLKHENQMHARLIQGTYLDGKPLSDFYEEYDMASTKSFNERAKGVKRLADLIAGREIKARQEHRAHLVKRLPTPTYSRFIGRDELLPDFTAQVMATDTPPIMAIEGMGGLGKTSLARELTLWLYDQGHIHHFGWVSAQQQQFQLPGIIQSTGLQELTEERLILDLRRQLAIAPDIEMSYMQAVERVEHYLQQSPHLIVVDNFETVYDREGLMPLIKRLAHHSRFLLTTREGLLYDPAIRKWALSELPLPLTREFLLYHADERVSQELTMVPENVERIHEVVGGNPLALRLVVGYLQHSSLTMLLDDLRHASGKTEVLYSYLFDHLWHSLSQGERRVWIATVFGQRSGVSMEDLIDFSEQSPSTVRAAVEHLRRRNAIDVIGHLDDPHYTVHNLTRTFLLMKDEG